MVHGARSAATRPRWRPWPSGPSTSGGSTPSPAPASAAARSACRSSTTARWCCSTGPTRFDSVQTLAHELGHAYHNIQLADAHADAAPAADGAGRDGQHLLRDAGGGGRPRRRHAATSAWPCSTSTSRAPRRWWSTSTAACCSRPRCSAAGAERTLSPTELCELMTDAQREAYGDGLDDATLPPVHVGGEAALLQQPLLQLALHLRAAVRPRAVRRVRARPRARSATATTTCWRRSAWPTPPSSAAASASTCATRRSGRRASTCCGGRIADYEALAADRSLTSGDRPLRRRPATELADAAGRRAPLPRRAGVAGPLRAAGRRPTSSPRCRRRCGPGWPTSCRPPSTS